MLAPLELYSLLVDISLVLICFDKRIIPLSRTFERHRRTRTNIYLLSTNRRSMSKTQSLASPCSDTAASCVVPVAHILWLARRLRTKNGFAPTFILGRRGRSGGRGRRQSSASRRFEECVLWQPSVSWAQGCARRGSFERL